MTARNPPSDRSARAAPNRRAPRSRTRRTLRGFRLHDAVERRVDQPTRARPRIAPFDPAGFGLDVVQRYQSMRAPPTELRDLLGVGVSGAKDARGQTVLH